MESKSFYDYILPYLSGASYEHIDKYGGIVTLSDGTAFTAATAYDGDDKLIGTFISFCINRKDCILYHSMNMINELDEAGEDISDYETIDEKKFGRSIFRFVFNPIDENPSLRSINPPQDGNCNEHEWYGCTKLIKDNGWKIPDNYPRKI